MILSFSQAHAMGDDAPRYIYRVVTFDGYIASQGPDMVLESDLEFGETLVTYVRDETRSIGPIGYREVSRVFT